SADGVALARYAGADATEDDAVAVADVRGEERAAVSGGSRDSRCVRACGLRHGDEFTRAVRAERAREIRRDRAALRRYVVWREVRPECAAGGGIACFGCDGRAMNMQ